MESTNEIEEDPIKIGDYIIIQRQKYTKLFRFNNVGASVILGKDNIELANINSKPYMTTFRMVPKGKRSFSLEVCESAKEVSDVTESIGIKECGTDNRNIIDDGQSQALSAEEILKLRENFTSSTEIVAQLIENSTTFHTKTEYSQEKYLKRKEKKYFEFIQIRHPSIRLLAEIFYRQDPEKILGMRMDTLSQLISYSGVCDNGNYLLYESGTNGLLPASLLNSIGANTDGKLVHMHPGNFCQKQAILALNLPDEQTDRCISVNLYSVLRHYYQNDTENGVISDKIEVIDESRKRKLSETDTPEKSSKIQKTDAEQEKVDEPKNTGNGKEFSNEKKTPGWVFENEKACTILREQMDGLVVVAREHPSNILKTLLPFVKPSRPVVVYGLSKELLMELYVELKTTSIVTSLRLTSNWMRTYQILPNRTHPDVSMSSTSGYLLYGYTVR